MTTSAAADTTPPTAPTSLSATVASSAQINLNWTASTDNVGVTGYLVERCQGSACSSFTQIGTPTAISYSDTGLTVSTSYSYRVRATDAAGNFPGGHLELPHPWTGQNPPLDGGGTRDDYAV